MRRCCGVPKLRHQPNDIHCMPKLQRGKLWRALEQLSPHASSTTSSSCSTAHHQKQHELVAELLLSHALAVQPLVAAVLLAAVGEVSSELAAQAPPPLAHDSRQLDSINRSSSSSRPQALNPMRPPRIPELRAGDLHGDFVALEASQQLTGHALRHGHRAPISGGTEQHHRLQSSPRANQQQHHQQPSPDANQQQHQQPVATLLLGNALAVQLLAAVVLLDCSCSSIPATIRRFRPPSIDPDHHPDGSGGGDDASSHGGRERLHGDGGKVPQRRAVAEAVELDPPAMGAPRGKRRSGQGKEQAMRFGSSLDGTHLWPHVSVHTNCNPGATTDVPHDCLMIHVSIHTSVILASVLGTIVADRAGLGRLG
nr:unnamed protein product [Digitaria exilis]